MTPRTPSPFITDAEILELPGVDLLTLDELDRNPETQKPEGKDARPRDAVMAHLAARGVSLDLEQP